ncbi:alkene reductase [Chryseobacterium salivictor]|uniref:N-ethylmaleimide reductase n=1 Tax=Chryseobacterium salivictor TaxID=2547600 RepID=A0A4P6ZGU7_9FLAO|nr:alkene reductase [Chryseobacterium salivictor]QBO58812.1 N-ethylmaleimide reductase [Chryseobacterium salivictor]
MNSLETLFSPYQLGSITLKNRIVMAPMTRSRATGNIPNDLMAQYYGSRASAGLIITEGTAPSPNGLGYARIPGIYSDGQIAGWKKVTDAVHQAGGKIFVQLMHTGRISHPLNMPEGAEVIGASPIAAVNTQMYTDQEAMQSLPVPREVATAEIPTIIAEFVHAAKSAVAAGFDGVELHAANGYLLEQFLNTASNQRTDAYGGSIENRNRLVLEAAEAVAAAIGKDKTGIRLSPFGAFGEMLPDETTGEQYAQLAAGLKAIGILYIHVVDHSSMGTPTVPQSVKDAIRKEFGGTIILSGGYDADRAEADLKAGKGDLVAFARPFIANPDLVKKFAAGAALAAPDPDTFYTPGEKGYTDYPVSAI